MTRTVIGLSDALKFHNFTHNHGRGSPNMIKPAAALAALLVSAALAPAQTSYGSIVGTVTDATRSAIPGAPVILINIGTGDRRSVPSDAVGNYQFVNLIPGSY